MPEEPFYVRFRGRTSGPFPVGELRHMVARGQLSRMHQVSADQANWCRAHEEPTLKSAFDRQPPVRSDTSVPIEPMSPAETKPEAAQKPQQAVPAPADTGEPPVAQDDISAGTFVGLDDIADAAEPPLVQDDDRWYYTHGDKALGPVSRAMIQRLILYQKLRPDALVWRPGMGDWKSLADAGVGERLPPAAWPASERYAGFWLRICATTMDQMILAFMGFTAGIGIGAAAPGLMVALNSQWQAQTALLLVGAVLSWFYSAALESSPLRGTLGKMALCLYVVDSRGERLSFARASGRHFAKYLSALTIGVGFVMVAFEKRKQGLHDMVADTLVLRQ